MQTFERLLIEIPTPQCHATTVCRTKTGCAVAWFGGTAEKDDDVGIFAAKITENGVSDMQKVSREENIPHWNPVLWKTCAGTIRLYYKVGYEIADWVTYFAESDDDGKTWSKPRILAEGDTSGGRGPVKNKPLRLSDGTVLAPASSEQGKWRAFVDRSADDGRTFERTAFFKAPVNPLKNGDGDGNGDGDVDGKPVGMIQPTLWESDAKKGHVHAFLRTDAGKIARADSEDFGKTWNPAYLTDLPNNNSGIDLTKTAAGTLVLACNPVSGNWKERTPLVLMASHDDGETWEQVFVLENTPGEYSYPAIIPDDGEGENAVALTYTWNRQKVAFWKIRL